MISRIKEKIQGRMLISAMPTALFLVFLFGTMVNNCTRIVKNTAEMGFSVQGLTTMIKSFKEEALQENLCGKYSYIDLNGLTTRTLGINSLNERQKLANGYLSTFEETIDVSQQAENVIELNEFLSEQDIDFVYVLAPSKASVYDAKFAPGYGSEAWKNIDAMINALSGAGVNTIDLDNWYEENGWDTEDVFFATDHHWKPEAALEAVHCTMEELSCKGYFYNKEWLQEESYEVTTYENWFLGSSGRRTGVTYAGVDDFKVYIPKFDVNYTYSYCSDSVWNYSDTILDLHYFKRKNFEDNVYCAYMINDWEIRNTYNEEAINEKKVLLIGDSYKMPYEYFLSTQFQEIYTIDLRYYTDGTLAEYIEEIQPNLVLMCSYEKALSEISLYNFGVVEYLEACEVTSESNVTDEIEIGDVAISAQEENDNNFAVVYAELEANQAYTLTVESTTYTGGEDSYLQMTLQNLSTNTAVYNRYFEANSEETQKWIFTTPEDENGVYAIYLYAGTKGRTNGAFVKATGIKLQKGVF